MYGLSMARDAALDYIDEVKRLYRERTGANDLFPAEEPRLLTSGESQPPQDAYSYELARLNAANGTDLTRTVSAFDVRPQIALLPGNVGTAKALPEPAVLFAPEQETAIADIYKEAYHTVKATPKKRYPTPKIWGTFPPYDKSFSEANELATRWAHREDIEAGYQKAISYHGKWYLIEKFDSSDLGYQIVGKMTDKEYNDFARRYEDDKSNGSRQSLHEKIDWFGE